MWATFPNMLTCLAMMRTWGFEVRGVFCTWLKLQRYGTNTRSNQGSYTGGCTEILLMGTRGPFAGQPPGIRIVSRGKLGHSVKPDACFPLVLDFARTHELGKPVEMFARCTTREGFDFQTGNQQVRILPSPPAWEKG